MSQLSDAPYLYRCTLWLLETTYFASREVSSLYQTEPLIGHIALCYALGLAPVRYTNTGTIHYKEDLQQLNRAGVYVTPAAIAGTARYHLGQFNAQPETYWSAMGNNLLVTVPAGAWAEKNGPSWYVHEGERRRKLGTENRPQVGRIRALGIATSATFYVISTTPQQLPSYIRLGKWMSKAHVATEPVKPVAIVPQGTITGLLAPADLPDATTILAGDQITVKPTPLLQRAHLRGACYQLADGELVPCGMRFAVEDLP
ncbi:MAG: type I-D CRISPR-associated protein Cas5/Csc1 [Chloroflexaceae bacterium]|nr:type I-D CRISPR-associated protein Cas5/Csc1 [Chloroflexaceae bacterium]